MKSEYIVKLFKLITGDEFIAHYAEPATAANHNLVKFENPCRVQEDPENPGNLQFLPWLPLAQSRIFQIEPETIMLTADVHEQLANAHMQQFGPRIEIAKSPLILVPH